MSNQSSELGVEIQTFGCKVNSYDSGLIEKRLLEKQSQLSSQFKKKEIHILNTCAVTHEATKEALRSVRRIKKKSPHAFVVVTGCSAQVDTDFFSEVSDVDLIVANSHKGQLEELIDQKLQGQIEQKLFKSNIFKKEDLESEGGVESHHTRSFVKIQDGCNSFCTYCVIPFARGKSRSLTVDQLVHKVSGLYDQGVREVVLTGVHIGDYCDNSYLNGAFGLEDLVEQLLLRTQMPRFRLSSLEPVELSEKLLDLYSDERLCPHFHMSIQSAQTEVLKDMKRQYTSKDVEEALLQIEKKVSKAFVGMDVIVGFPTEDNVRFQETLKRLSDLPWTKAHVFPYSERPGTFAARFKDQVSDREKKERSQSLREVSLQRYSQQALNQIDEVKQGLLIKKKKGGYRLLSRDYWSVELLNTEVFSEALMSPYAQQKEWGVKIVGYEPSRQSINSPLTGYLLENR